jgi:hypothetical protein
MSASAHLTVAGGHDVPLKKPIDQALIDQMRQDLISQGLTVPDFKRLNAEN